MKLAWRELRRAPGRFFTAGTILTLLAVLLMFLGSLLDGLLSQASQGVAIQDGDAIVFSAASHGSFIRSRIDGQTQMAISTIEGITDSGGLSVVLLGGRIPGTGEREVSNVAVWGYELAPRGVPAPPPSGHAWADRALEADGLEIDDTIMVGPARTPVIIDGWVENTSYHGQPGLWANLATWHEVIVANRPGARLADDAVQAVVIRGESAGINHINTQLGDTVSALTVDETVAAIPGFTAQQSTFNQIQGVTIMIALVVAALFFALLTVERIPLYGVLKAIGSRSRTLFIGLVFQAIVVTISASLIAAVAVIAIDAVIPPGSVPLAVSPVRLLFSAVLLIAAAAVGCGFSLRRILRVDPASALGGS